jgi:hypothetical protein
MSKFISTNLTGAFFSLACRFLFEAEPAVSFVAYIVGVVYGYILFEEAKR